MTFFYIFLGVYLLSLLIVGPLHSAMYQDDKKKSNEPPMVDKVMKLYIIPFCPILNTIVGVKYVGDYLDTL